METKIIILIITISMLLLSCNPSPKTVDDGDTIKVHYVGTLENGTIFDSSEERETPFQFTVGAGQVIPGFNDAVLGLKVGDETNVHLQPEDAYGVSRPEYFQTVSKDMMPEPEKVKIGMAVEVLTGNGQPALAYVSDVEEDTITLDLNHPLAGKILNFKIKVVEIIS